MFPLIRKPLGLFKCCISSKSDIGCTKITRELIGSPTDFKHILHLNADDANSDDIIEFLTGQKVPGSPISSHFDALESKGTIV